MAYAFSPADVAFLRSGDGARALAECRELDPARIADVEAARRIVGERAAPVLETVVLQRKAAAKLAVSGWLFTSDALQQASATAVARHRAERLAGRDVHDVTCSIGADLAELAKVARRALGSDLDEVRLAMARHNCPDVPLACADALHPVSRGTVVVADPARRDAKGRRRRPDDLTPPLNELVAAYAGRELAVKCAPGLDYAALRWADEVELVSLDGAVREACVWTGDLATAPRRATVLRTGGPQWTITSDEPDDIGAGEPGQWLVDPDGAVVRAGLVKHYGARHGLWQLDERIAYLTGDEPPPGVRAFRILEHGPYQEKSLRALLKRREIGRLEILVRGLDLDPDALRRRLKLGGPNEATVVLTRIGRSPVGFLCEAARIPPA